MSKRIPILICFILVGLFRGLTPMAAQEAEDINRDEDTTKVILQHLESDIPIGNIYINQDRRIDSLLRKHLKYNDSIGIQGWRILVYRGRELKKAQDAGAKFAEKFPELELNTVVDYQAPDFKTLVGAFRTREEAYKLHQLIKSEFEFSYLVQATIKAGELK